MMTDLKQRILERVQNDLKEIEAELNANLTPYLDVVTQTAHHIMFSGGKRLRPLLMVMASRLCSYKGTSNKKYSIIFEYLHTATLLHDDLVDGASMRRGQPAAHAVYGNEIAVLVGDFLLARALSIAAETRKIAVIQTIARVTEDMSQGEIHQLLRKGIIALSEEEYLEVIENKTARLIESACRVGAQIADASESEEGALAEYGFNLGVAFQMADDLLDYLSESTVLGKRIGADLREGKLTLPVISALDRVPPDDRDWMVALIEAHDFSDAEFQRLVGLLESSGGLAYTREKAEDYVKRAKGALQGFAPSETRETLEMIADYALARKI